jgi:hypothetical protein
LIFAQQCGPFFIEFFFFPEELEFFVGNAVRELRRGRVYSFLCYYSSHGDFLIDRIVNSCLFNTDIYAPQWKYGEACRL